MLKPESYQAGRWIGPGMAAQVLRSPVTGEEIAQAGSAIDAQAMLDHGRGVGGPALRALGFHDRARMLKALGQYLDARKEALYALNPLTGATRRDGWIDIDGGILTLFAFASKGRREMPDGQVYLDGGAEGLSRDGDFIGQHIATPLRGVGVHINAFNFPVWGMLEKLAPCLLAGVPAIVKPATQTSFLAEAAFRMIVESGILPEGAVQLIVGGTGDLLDRLGAQDVVSFTGSAQTALKLRQNPALVRNSTRFIAEQDSLNAAILGADATPDSVEFSLFVKEAVAEITTKAGQKCTAMRRLLVPAPRADTVTEALVEALRKVPVGDPADKAVRMGALVSLAQKRDVLEKAARIGAEARRVTGDPDRFDLLGADPAQAFLPPMLFRCDDPDAARALHEVEAFGPVSTVMPYRDAAHAAALVNRGGGSLVASLFSHDPDFARTVALETAAWHGRLYLNDRDSAAGATGHGAPLPMLVHGGPGRAGGGEEMGGIRGVMHYMQRTAVQGSPRMIAALTGQWAPGAPEVKGPEHPFRRSFEDLQIGETLWTGSRTITLEDIEHFAHFTGDTFYAHMDQAAAEANPFFPGRVAHGYLLLSFAAGLFVQPDPGPVLANTGLNGLAFKKPVSPGDAIRVRLTCARKTRRTGEYGEVAWAVLLVNQDAEPVAEYELLTMVSYRG
ncbi:enoyl-CoA hydratase [Defluviimonas sp. 20V17]|uniref:Bifunctional aldehyde dehydrogenase/enoyl-CoA hydratase n=1 Tax=Allgaiera indica TaxID=765699 RepID=A0AAN5A092_9RHOB|nr:phenylacetic acid degradation bifunctional protein PaaZ [Allgaiera indica]KDB02722.1 enoyl-CoA hydratase [Defluviimonas sp. 20V17]GHE01733.1 bifunctional aldehyde dehydrogenase/enoyl-CoA hydratase [Allgaiera indica]SDW94196.1 oxepin-CoA hydrolase / 3-oxo-5,6-dehydrosuberyl-CoA semialdehyde dehydrogenase [Allgaiera indica]